MGQFVSPYVPEHSQRIIDRARPATAAPAPVPPAKPARRTKPVRKAAPAVTPNSPVTPNAGGTNESRKRGRPRLLSDEQRRERVRQRVADWRAAGRVKAGKAGS